MAEGDNRARYTNTASVDRELFQTAAAVTINPAGNNNSLVYTAKVAGTAGNSITVTYVDPGGNDEVLGIVVTGTDIVVNLATDGAGAITSTGDDIKAAIIAEADANELVSVADAAANDGSGVVTAISETPLTGGLSTVTKDSPITKPRVSEDGANPGGRSHFYAQSGQKDVLPEHTARRDAYPIITVTTS